MKHIVVFGAGKSSTYLIEYLIAQLTSNRWRLTVLDADLRSAQEKTGHHSNAFAAYIDISNDEQRRKWVAEADIVVSLMPPALHYLVALDCIEFSKNLLTASYVDDRMLALNDQVKSKDLLFLCEAGLDPGIDHMSAMKILDDLRIQGAEVYAFRSHCGGLVAPESDTNPWRYKISWNPRNIVLAGKAGAVFRAYGTNIRMEYEELFDHGRIVNVDEIGPLAYYPNRDSSSYLPVYHLENAETFLRTTLRYPEFCFGWKNVIDLKLTDESVVYNTDGMTLQNFFQQHLQQHGFSEWIQNQLTTRFIRSRELLEKLEELISVEGKVDDELLEELQDFMMVDPSGNLQDVNLEDVKTNAAATVAGQMHEANTAMKQLFFLGMSDDVTMINKGMCSAADVLQFSLEKNLALQPHDRDMIVMLHEIDYRQDGEEYRTTSLLIVKGEDSTRTAMAKTVGLPLGICTKLVLQGKLHLRGIHIPVMQDIYDPVLAELKQHGIEFREIVTKTSG